MPDPRSNDAPLASGRAVVRRYRPGKDGNWVRTLPDAPNTAVKGDDASSWVVEVDGRAVGILTWTWIEPIDNGAAVISRLYVEPAARQRGLGTQLYRRAVSEIRKSFRKVGVHLKTILLPGDPADPAAAACAASLKFDGEGGAFTRHL